MSTAEKIFAVFALLFLAGLILSLLLVPETRRIAVLAPLGLAGVGVNAGLLFIVFRDICTRSFPSQKQRYFWGLLILFFLPAVLAYLPLHGFRHKQPAAAA